MTDPLPGLLAQVVEALSDAVTPLSRPLPRGGSREIVLFGFGQGGDHGH
ncbi:hypothetical protein GTA51_11295 [Desulfovibrio aerotolerans]|uniref:Uncharacterized protein n=1 Tax=Solidesulfovibrio aerotolerans TaxID=295255 RepID=A0A7C9N2A9_9BACT|nr:hypothetical protein [Solidesulfovibrio aerotolerans]MYL83711.1 hypothetical protein [Solidesulfovibrio aerotolerans]